MADQNEDRKKSGRGKGNAPETSIHLTRSGEWNLAKNEVPIRLVGFMGQGPMKNTDIVFTINSTQAVENKRTDENGALELNLPYPKDVTEFTIKAEAILAGKPNGSVKLSPPKKAAEPTDSELVLENTPIGNGEHFYYVVNVDKSGRPFEDVVTFMPKQAVHIQVQNVGDDDFIDHGEKTRPFNLLVPKEGLRIHLVANKPGLYEIDAIPRKNPRSKKEIRVYGKRQEAIKAPSCTHPLVQFWDGCI